MKFYEILRKLLFFRNNFLDCFHGFPLDVADIPVRVPRFLCDLTQGLSAEIVVIQDFDLHRIIKTVDYTGIVILCINVQINHTRHFILHIHDFNNRVNHRVRVSGSRYNLTPYKGCCFCCKLFQSV